MPRPDRCPRCAQYVLPRGSGISTDGSSVFHRQCHDLHLADQGIEVLARCASCSAPKDDDGRVLCLRCGKG
jgi:hypothetical protein